MYQQRITGPGTECIKQRGSDARYAEHHQRDDNLTVVFADLARRHNNDAG